MGELNLFSEACICLNIMYNVLIIIIHDDHNYDHGYEILIATYIAICEAEIFLRNTLISFYYELDSIELTCWTWIPNLCSSHLIYFKNG